MNTDDKQPDKPDLVVGVFSESGEETDHDNAFEAGYPDEWRGQKLEAWDIVRESHFLSLRASERAPAMAALLSRPGGFLADSLRILWLCATNHAAIRSAARMGIAQMACDEWALKHVPPAANAEALRLGLRIYNLAHANDVVPLKEAGPAEGE